MQHDIHAEKILILDFGSQYSQLIARRLREIGVYCELHPYDLSAEKIKAFAPKGIILSGGPDTVTQTDTPRINTIVFELGCPILGICYGMQALAMQLNGKVERGDLGEFGLTQVTITKSSLLLDHIEDHDRALDVWMSHNDHVTQLPEGFQCIAITHNHLIAAMSDEARHYYGIQFHAEVTHTKQGTRILKRFVQEICHCNLTWKADQIVEDLIVRMKKQVGTEQVILGLSGGVDSTVAAALLHRAIGSQLICVFVDHGLLRKNEQENIQQLFATHFNLNIHYIDAQKDFLSALKGITDPEAKRKIIGKTFIDIFEQTAKQFPEAKWLAQGTIYPDVIESAANSHQSKVIKSHHNVGGLPEHMNFKLLEPLRELFKDEVRTLGLELGLPYDMVYRHPFPGPGLAVRILGEIKPEYIAIVREADHIFLTELKEHDLYHKVSQAFAVFLPVKTVGVVGDERAYEYVIALRAVETTDFMTAHWAELPHAFLGKVANRIINEIPQVARVVYDISSKPPATIEWE